MQLYLPQSLLAALVQIPVLGIFELNYHADGFGLIFDENVAISVARFCVGNDRPFLPMAQEPQQNAMTEALPPSAAPSLILDTYYF